VAVLVTPAWPFGEWVEKGIWRGGRGGVAEGRKRGDEWAEEEGTEEAGAPSVIKYLGTPNLGKITSLSILIEVL
jgi:hypothetical protein